ncbi:MAG: universal stress protein [Deltaproteobacteria bacterium]|nr:MAG: universal stress protein [Deltaproteobacteria bacterium]
MRIALAIDLYDEPEELLARALPWATRLRGVLDLYFAQPIGEAWAVGVSDPTVLALLESERSKIRASQRQQLDALLASIPEDERGHAELFDASPAEALEQISRKADLLLVGTHGRQGLSRFLLGSVAEKAVRMAHCPVLVLRPHEDE